MNTAPVRETRETEQSIAGPDRFMLFAFIGFFVLITAFIIGDMVAALLR